MFHIPAHKQVEHDQIEDYDQYYDLICLGMDPDEAKQDVIEALNVELIPFKMVKFQHQDAWKL